MLDRVKFMETLAELADYAEMNGGVLTKTEVEEAFQEMELEKEQYDLIFRYLFEKKIAIQGIEPGGQGNVWREGVPGQNGTPEKEGMPGRKGTPARKGMPVREGTPAWKGMPAQEGVPAHDSTHLKMYLQELEALPRVSENKRLELAMLLSEGREDVLPDLLHASLYQVIEIARTYRGHGVFLEDLIQEGNIGLMLALDELNGKKTQDSPLLYIKESIQYAMEQYIDSQAARGSGEERLVAKLALLHEAAKALSEENGVLPTISELSEYTKIPEEEISDMVLLSKDVDFFK